MTNAEQPTPAGTTPTETAVTEIWTDLGLPVETRNDDFFSIGGDSLTLVRFLARVQERWEIELPIDALFDGDFTVTAAANLIEQERLGSADDDEIAAAMAELEALSDEELQALLGESVDDASATPGRSAE